MPAARPLTDGARPLAEGARHLAGQPSRLKVGVAAAALTMAAGVAVGVIAGPAPADAAVRTVGAVSTASAISHVANGPAAQAAAPGQAAPAQSHSGVAPTSATLTSATLTSATPTGPAATGPALTGSAPAGSALTAPTLAAPTAPAPTLSGPALSGGALPGPALSTAAGSASPLEQAAAGQPASSQPSASPVAATRQVPAAQPTPANPPSAQPSSAAAAPAHPVHPAHRVHRAPKPAAPAPPRKPYLIYDSVTPRQIPSGRVVATYADGPFAVSPSQLNHAKWVLWIDVNGSDPNANVLDVEPGDASPSTAAAWAHARLAGHPHGIAVVYTMRSEWPAVRAAIGTLPARMRSHVRYWIADPNGIPHVVRGSSATQWAWGHSYDISTALPNF